MNPMSPPLADLLMKALLICIDVHKEQRDRRGMPYVFHPIRVSEKQITMERKIIGLLHDTIEGPGGISIEYIGDTFGPAIAASVAALSRRDGESWDAYMNRVLEDKDASMVKLADLEDNMSPARLDKKALRKATEVYFDAYSRICDKYNINAYLTTCCC